MSIQAFKDHSNYRNEDSEKIILDLQKKLDEGKCDIRTCFFTTKIVNEKETLVIVYAKRIFDPNLNGERKIVAASTTLDPQRLEEEFGNDPNKVLDGLIDLIGIDFDRTLTFYHFYADLVKKNIPEVFHPKKFKLEMAADKKEEHKQQLFKDYDAFFTKNIYLPEIHPDLLMKLATCRHRKVILVSNNENEDLFDVFFSYLCHTIPSWKNVNWRDLIVGLHFGKGNKVDFLLTAVANLSSAKGVIDIVGVSMIDDDYHLNLIPIAEAGGAIFHVDRDDPECNYQHVPYINDFFKLDYKMPEIKSVSNEEKRTSSMLKSSAARILFNHQSSNKEEESASEEESTSYGEINSKLIGNNNDAVIVEKRKSHGTTEACVSENEELSEPPTLRIKSQTSEKTNIDAEKIVDQTDNESNSENLQSVKSIAIKK